MRTIYYTLTTGTNTGLFLDRGAVKTIHAKDTPTAQPPTPLRELAEIEARLKELRPNDRFQHMRLSETAFWHKVSEVRPACTIDENPDDYTPSWDNE